jgi:hypothetical protein
LFTAASNLFSVVTSVLCSDFRSLQRLLFSATTPVIYGDFCSQTDNLYYSHKSTLFSAGNLFFAALWRTTRTAADNFSLHPCGVLRAQRLTIFLGGPAADYARSGWKLFFAALRRTTCAAAGILSCIPSWWECLYL